MKHAKIRTHMQSLRSSLSSSTCVRKASISCSTTVIESLSDADMTSSSWPVMCCTELANRFMNRCQLSSLREEYQWEYQPTPSMAHKSLSKAACSTNRSNIVNKSAFN